MRILFTFAGGRGHAEPLVPIARAAVTTGHAVAFSGRASVVGALPFDGFPDPVVEADLRRRVTPLVPFSVAREEAILRDGFAGTVARARAHLVLGLCERWRPDVVVSEEVDYGPQLAAERYGAARVTVVVLASGGFARESVVGPPLAALRSERGLPEAAPPPELLVAPWSRS